MRRLLFLIPFLLMGCGLLTSPTSTPELPTPVPTPEFVAPTSSAPPTA
ncbi:MAG: sugar ABC transporter substrate-binding protein, partial [Chloroflexi bacterium]|nr:sugar ABC transporter substrate-binding protein [Chloroflexota bacterium]